MGELFGTDGVRGIPGRYPLDDATLSRLAQAAAFWASGSKGGGNGHAPAVLMGRDTRSSGPALCRALSRGFRSAGWRTLDLGVAPTPAISYLTPKLGARCGVVISASHNPAEFNGVKFMDSLGFKMDPAGEADIERRVRSGSGAAILKTRFDAEDVSKELSGYLEFLRSTFPASLDLDGLKIVLDCGHGAASMIASGIFSGLGARVYSIAAEPDGRNINRASGALYPESMQRAVQRRGADCGISLDGDADRAIMADEKGRLLDGDSILCLSAMRLKSSGLLRANKVVLTVMSNFGLIRYLGEQGLSVVTVPVGDRHVTQAIEAEGLSLGGEASGHLVFRSYAATGDGLLTALQALAALRESGGPLSRLRDLYRPTPQIIRNVDVVEKIPLEHLHELERSLRRCEKRLGSSGRIVLRYSGTEPLLRIMVEGPSASIIRGMAAELVNVFRKETTAKRNPKTEKKEGRSERVALRTA